MIRLDGDELERQAKSAYLGGRISDAMLALQRAQQFHARQGDHRRAARSAFWLGFLLLGRGELAQGSGWLARARRLLEHEPPDCPEQGYLLLPATLELLEAGDPAAARATAARAAGIGRQAGEADLVGLALFLQGAAAVTGGDVAEGLALLDEAMVAVVAGELSPEVTGWVYCGVIDVCQEVSELRRAREWTGALAAWCDSRPDMVTFTGQCLVHRAEILRLGGAWAEAVEAARRAAERLAEADDEQAIGAAAYQRAEVHRVLGELDAAAELAGIAGDSGTPALLAAAGHARGAVLLATGDAEAAVATLRGAWRAWRDLGVPYEAARVRVLVGLACRALGDTDAAAMELDAARTVLAGLGAVPDLDRLDRLAGAAGPDASPGAGGLTGRELEVLRLVAAGKTNHAIASALHLADKTVHRHVSNIYSKLGVSSRAAATAYAYEHDLVR
ncbi:MAG TPA: response regulator transcription factor [Actinomycetes bacterium]|nr:response regulator transcription factor [Actinomycetes bacterium]